MSANELLWLFAGIGIGIALLSIPAIRKRPPIETSRAPIRFRSKEHEAKLNALSDWLAEPKIVRAILKSRYASGDGLKALAAGAGQFKREELDEAVKQLLADRGVRMVICDYMVRKRGLPHDRTMESLLDWAGKRVA